MKALFLAIAMVESSLNPTAINPAENAVGIVQIRPVCVEDCNRILKLNNSQQRYTLEDRYCPEKSKEMFALYTSYYYEVYRDKIPSHMNQWEARSRIWNGGPNGWKKESTLSYWKRVQKELKK